MSKGHIIEGTLIAVDWWKSHIAPQIELYFLSHLYPDITEGLPSTWNKPIYTSDITARLLILEKPSLSTLVRPLHFGKRYTPSPYKSKTDSVQVTLIDSKFCPGSAAFLFEGSFGKILYTGPFRFYPNIFSGIDISKINVLYFDNTYCSEECQFPAQSNLTGDILEYIKRHFGVKRIILACDSIGKEELLFKIHKETGCRIRVCTQRMRFLQAVGLSRIARTNVEQGILLIDLSQVSKESIIKYSSEMPTEILLLSSRYVISKTKPFKKRFNVSVIPFSSHSSFPELVEFVKLVQPLKLQPIILEPVKGMFDPNQGSLLSLTVLLDRVKKSLDITEHEWVLDCLPNRFEDIQEKLNLLVQIGNELIAAEEESAVQTRKIYCNDFNTQCSESPVTGIKKRMWNAFYHEDEDWGQNKIIQCNSLKERFLRSQETIFYTFDKNTSRRSVVEKKQCHSLDYQTSEHSSQAKRICPNSSKNVKCMGFSQSQCSQASSCTTVCSDDGETVTPSNSQRNWQYTQDRTVKSFPINEVRLGCAKRSSSKGRVLLETSRPLCKSPGNSLLDNRSKSSQEIRETNNHDFSQPSQCYSQEQLISALPVADQSNETSTKNGALSKNENIFAVIPKPFLQLIQKSERIKSKMNKKYVSPVINIRMHYKNDVCKTYCLTKEDL